MARLTVALALPAEELGPVERELALAGYDVVPVATPEEFAILLETRREFALAVLDGESDFDKSIEFYSLLHENGRDIPALMVVSPKALEQLTGAVTRAGINDEYFTRPYSADSLRWRVEAMLIRSQTVDDGKGPIIESDRGISTTGGGPKRATIVAVFNPKGGVGKTTISMNLATTLQVRRGQRVLLGDADTVTGHIANSLGLD
ncbi:MAG: AAA family ATPase, partial [Chloroflexota bacterium]|nr:AAA family ATPase [Chloroflexota bacterium]